MTTKLITITTLILISATAGARTLRYVERVVDGDTVILNGNERVRLIGIDTPETVHPRKPVQCYGKEASDYLKKRLDNELVYLKYDSKRHDKYGRTLAYVFLNDNLVNAELIYSGLGFAYKKYPHKYKSLFSIYEKIARRSKAGLWSKCKTGCHKEGCFLIE